MENRTSILEGKLKGYWMPGQNMLCVSIIKNTNLACELCGIAANGRIHVLINTTTKATVYVDEGCISGLLDAIHEAKSDGCILYLGILWMDAKDIRSKYPNSTEFLNFKRSSVLLAKILSDRTNITYKCLDPILKLTSKFKTEEGKDLFQEALDIFVDERYYDYDSLNMTRKEYELRQKLEMWIEKETNFDDDREYHGPVYGDSYDSLSPEGLGLDEIDWDAHDFEMRIETKPMHFYDCLSSLQSYIHH